jgi:hypothetical protein
MVIDALHTSQLILYQTHYKTIIYLILLQGLTLIPLCQCSIIIIASEASNFNVIRYIKPLIKIYVISQ